MKCFHCARTLMAGEEKVPVFTTLQSGSLRDTDDSCVKCADIYVTVYGFNKPMIPRKKL